MSNFFQKRLLQLENISEGLRNAVTLRNREDATELTEVASKNNDKQLPLNVSEIEASDCRCRNMEDVFKYLDTVSIKTQLADSEKVLVLKIQLSEHLKELSNNELDKLSILCKAKPIVLLLTSRSEFKCLVYWKSKEMTHFATIVHYKEDFAWEDREMYNFVSDFLGESLRKGQTGFFKRFSINSNSKRIEIHKLADSRDYNLLLLAAESGNADVVEILINLGLSTEVQGVTAQSLAWQGRHSDVLIALAQADLPYPDGIDSSCLSEKFKKFNCRIEDFHAAIKDKNEDKVKEFIERNQNSKYFFNLSNVSAASIAISSRAFDIYEIFLNNNILQAQHEKKVQKKLRKRDKQMIREMHTKHSKDLESKHISILMAHSSISHNVPDALDKRIYVRKAYEYLSQDSRLDVILKVVSTSKKLKIIYDFTSDSVDFVDPTSNEYTEGIFYPTGKIIIGAKLLMDEATKNKAISTIAHELCHYAMNIIYENNAKPYAAHDRKNSKIFQKIFKECRKKSMKEDIIGLVYNAEGYRSDVQQAELIVRAPHIIAMYYEQKEKLNEFISNFPSLFDYYEKQVIPDMLRILPEIDQRVENKIDKLSKKQKELKFFLALTLVVLIVVTSFAAFMMIPKLISEIWPVPTQVPLQITTTIRTTTTTKAAATTENYIETSVIKNNPPFNSYYGLPSSNSHFADKIQQTSEQRNFDPVWYQSTWNQRSKTSTTTTTEKPTQFYSVQYTTQYYPSHIPPGQIWPIISQNPTYPNPININTPQIYQPDRVPNIVNRPPQYPPVPVPNIVNRPPQYPPDPVPNIVNRPPQYPPDPAQNIVNRPPQYPPDPVPNIVNRPPQYPPDPVPNIVNRPPQYPPDPVPNIVNRPPQYPPVPAQNIVNRPPQYPPDPVPNIVNRPPQYPPDPVPNIVNRPPQYPPVPAQNIVNRPPLYPQVFSPNNVNTGPSYRQPYFND